MEPTMALNDVIHQLVPQVGRQATVLAVGLPEIGDGIDHADVTHSPTGMEALELLRMLQVDLVITPSRLLDLSLKEFARRLHDRWPRQRWAVVKQDELSLLEEREIRQLSVLGIFEPMTPQRSNRVTLHVRRAARQENVLV
jgi:hypothetical protein